jgi:PAS domain S-box-containing protein
MSDQSLEILPVEATLDPARVADRIVSTVLRLFRARRATLYRLDRASGDLVCVATAGTGDDGPWLRQVVPAGMDLSGQAITEGRPVSSPDSLAERHLRLPPWARDRIREEDVRAGVGVPLIVGGEVLGTLVLGDRVGRVFDQEEIRLLTVFADQAALALANARLCEEAHTRLRKAETLLAVTRSIGSTLDLTETMRRLARETARALGADMVGAYVPDPDGSVLRSVAGYRVPRELRTELLEFPVPLRGHRFVEEAVAERRPGHSNDVATDPRIDRATVARFPHRGLLFLPLIAKGVLLGGLFAVWWREPHTFSAEELRLAEGIGRQAALALENARLYGETERQRWEAEALGRRFAALVEQLPVVTYVARRDDTGSTQYVSPQIESVLGFTQAEWLADPELWAKQVHPEDRERVLTEYQGAGDHLVSEYRLVGRDGRVRWVRDEARLLRDAGGEPLVFQGVLFDLTERRELETQLLQAQKMEAIGGLAAGVAHDFNNLLSVILGRAHLLLARLPAEDPLRRHARLIYQTGERAAALTRQLLAFSRKQVLKPKVLDLNSVVTAMEKILRRLIGEDIELVTTLDPDLGAVEADPGQLEQVILNLAVNARDAMPQGGTLQITTANVEPGEAAPYTGGGSAAAPFVVLSVRDSGVGMSAETQARIFEPFFTTKAPDKGTGLGLSTVYGIVTQSGGHVSVASAPGQGATFFVSLPRIGALATSPDAMDDARAVAGGGSETILLVEDAEDVRDLTREILTVHGYRVLEARHPGEALLIGERRTEPIHLLLTDVVMPEMNGRELAERLTALRPDLRVLFMSGYTDDAILRQGIRQSEVALLPKPVAPAELVQRIRDLLDVRDRHAEVAG